MLEMHRKGAQAFWRDFSKEGLTDGNSLLWSDIGPVLEVVVLPLLLRLQVQASQPAQVLAAHCLVDSGAPPDSLPVVVGHIGPPVSLLLDIPQDHVLNGSWQSRHLHPTAVCCSIPAWTGHDRCNRDKFEVTALLQVHWSRRGHRCSV